jgi:hypothetical protein
MTEAEIKPKLDRKSPIKPLPDEPDWQGRYEYFRRKLGFKAPVTLRYALLISFPVGLYSLVKKRSFWRLPLHLTVTTNIIGWALCYDELYGVADSYYKWKWNK